MARTGIIASISRKRLQLDSFDEPLQMSKWNGLLREVERAQSQALLGLLFGCDAGNHDDRDARVSHRRKLKEIQPAHAREPEVEQDQVGTSVLQAVVQKAEPG